MNISSTGLRGRQVHVLQTPLPTVSQHQESGEEPQCLGVAASRRGPTTSFHSREPGLGPLHQLRASRAPSCPLSVRAASPGGRWATLSHDSVPSLLQIAQELAEHNWTELGLLGAPGDVPKTHAEEAASLGWPLRRCPTVITKVTFPTFMGQALSHRKQTTAVWWGAIPCELPHQALTLRG